MPQEPQQVDLEELTRLRGDEYTYYAGLMIWKAFPTLRDELVRLREEVVEPRFCTDAAIVEMTNTIIGLRRQLDEAKGLLERIAKIQEMSYGDATSLHLDMIGLSREARTFLASLAGIIPTSAALPPCDHDECGPVECKQEQPTQGEVKS